LTDVTLSANVIERIEDTISLKLLRSLDLSSNRIRVINNLKGLPNLLSLNLSGNKIVSILPLQDIGSTSTKLREIDLSGNSIHDLKELHVLQKFPSLENIIFQQDEEFSNPIYDNKRLFIECIRRLNLPKNLKIDGVPLSELLASPLDVKNPGKQPSVNTNADKLNQQQGGPRSAGQNAYNPQNYRGGNAFRDSSPSPPATSLNGRATLEPQQPFKSNQGITKPQQQQLPDSDTPLPRPQPSTTQNPLSIQGKRITPDTQPVQQAQPANPQPSQSQPAHQAPQPQPRPLPIDEIDFLPADPPSLRPPPGPQIKSLQTEFSRLLLENDRLKLQVVDANGRAERLVQENALLQQRIHGLLSSDEQARGLREQLERSRRLLNEAENELRGIKEDRDAQARAKEVKESEVQELRFREKDFTRRIEESLRKAVEIGKDLDASREENRKTKEELSAANGQINELRRVVKSYENSLTAAHAESLKTNELSIVRIEDLSLRLREAEQSLAEHKVLLAQATDTKNTYFEEKLKLEAGLTNQLESLKLTHSAQVAALEESHRLTISSLKSVHTEQLAQAAAAQENALNSLEAEYKNLVLGANEKYRKLLEENKTLKDALKMAAGRNKELEGLLQEMGRVVEGVRKEYKENKTKAAEIAEKTEKDNTAALLKEDIRMKAAKIEALEQRVVQTGAEIERRDKLIAQLQKEVETLHGQILEKDKEVSDHKRSAHAMELKLQEQNESFKRIDSKFTILEEQRKLDEEKMLDALEDAKTELKIKANLLHEKTLEVERYKAELSHKDALISAEITKKLEAEELCKERIESEQVEYQKLRAKYQKKDDLLDEYEGQIEGLQQALTQTEEQVTRLRKELDEKGQLAQECLDRLQSLHTDKKLLEDNHQTILSDLQRTVDSLNNSLRQKNARVRELEEGMREIESAYKDRLAFLEENSKALQQDNAIKEREIRTLLFEIEKQKKVAKENLANLTKLFS
jgi:hypothetical protein